MKKAIFALLLLAIYGTGCTQPRKKDVYAEFKAANTADMTAAFTLKSLPTEADIKALIQPQHVDSFRIIFNQQKKWLTDYFNNPHMYPRDPEFRSNVEIIYEESIDSLLTDKFYLDRYKYYEVPMLKKFNSGFKLIRFSTVDQKGRHKTSFYWTLIDNRLVFLWTFYDKRWRS